MKIVEAQISDAEEILKLQKLAYISEAELHDDFDIPPLTQTLEELKEDFKVKTFLKAEDEGRLVASGQVYLVDGSAHIGRMAVFPEYQGRGIGSKLMAALEGVFPKAISYNVFTGENSRRNLGMYERRGYRRVRRQKLGNTTIVFLSRPGS